ncbi:MAG: YfhO family protein [Erysipelotrichaceae bacterium]|nr:YfhO family protein [Erysipelotrichaceae bacterium]
MYYSLLFVITSLAVFSYFYLNGKTFISHGDGIRQHYKVFLYFSRYLKDILGNLIHQHKLIIPQWDFTIGEGSDILASLHYYAINDPFTFPVVFVPEKYVYAYYDFIILLKMYLSGLAFIHLCLYVKRDHFYAVLSGSMIYVFCYWVLLNASRHIFFLTPMLYMPLVILGVEKIIRENKPMVFIWSVFLSAISQFYFFYMIVLLTVFYVAIRALTLYRLDLKKIGSLIGKLLLGGIMALGMAAIVVAPMFYILLNNGRIGIDYALHLFYERFYYERLFTVLLADDHPDSLCMGLAAPVILSLILAFRNVRKDPFITSINMAMIVFIVFPFFGKLFNGMGYVNNRWSFVIALVAAYTFVCEYEEFTSHKKLLLIVVPVFIVAGMVSAWSRTLRVIVPCVIAMAYTGSLFLKWKYKEVLLLALIIINLCFNADNVYSQRGSDRRASSSISAAQAQIVAQDNEAYELKQYLEEAGIVGHIKYSGSDLNDNVSMLNGLAGTSYYFSIANSYVADMRGQLGITEYSLYRFYSLDQRGTLFTLGNARYYLTPEDYDGLIPYGFEYVKTLKGYDLYEDANALPWGYTYAKAISYEDWNQLDPVAKQEVMTKAIVVEGGQNQVSAPCTELSYVFKDAQDLEVTEKGFAASADKAGVTLQLNEKKAGEYYLYIGGLEYWDGHDYYEETLGDVTIDVKAEGITRTIEYHTNEYEFYNGRHEYVAYLGYYENDLNEVELELSNAGSYDFTKLEVICADKTEYTSRMKELAKECPSEITFGTDEIDCTITVNDERYMLLAVPYAKGWKAYVDGKEAEILRANSCYMALKLEAGTHAIHMTYETPFLKLGGLISVASFIVMAAYTMLKRHKKV